MTIKNFSKDVYLVTAEHNLYTELDTHVQNIAKESMEKVINRLMKLGFTDFKLMGDDSLALEAYDSLTDHGVQPTVVSMYPESARELLLNHLIDQRRNKLILESTKLTITHPPSVKRMLEQEMHLSRLLSTKVNLVDEISETDKLRIIKMIVALSSFGMEATQKNINESVALYYSFLEATGRTNEEIENLIMNDLDYRWKWAQEKMNEATFPSMQNEDSFDESFNRSDANHMDLMDLLNAETEETSNLVIDINEDQIDRSVAVKENIGTDVDQLSLTDGLTTLSKSEFVKSESLVEELNNVLKAIDTYSEQIYYQLIENSNLIVDFYISRTSSSSKKLPYSNASKTKIILSVDIKTGDVEAYFKGSPFKLNPFFEKGEEVKTNVMEW